MANLADSFAALVYCPSLDLNNDYIDSLGENLEYIKPMQDPTFDKRMTSAMNNGAMDVEIFCKTAIDRFHKDTKPRPTVAPFLKDMDD